MTFVCCWSVFSKEWQVLHFLQWNLYEITYSIASNKFDSCIFHTVSWNILQLMLLCCGEAQRKAIMLTVFSYISTFKMADEAADNFSHSQWQLLIDITPNCEQIRWHAMCFPWQNITMLARTLPQNLGLFFSGLFYSDYSPQGLFFSGPFCYNTFLSRLFFFRLFI